MAPKISKPRASESQTPAGFVLNTSSTQPEKRKALDGRLYTYRDFIDHYGERRGNEKWTQAAKIRTFDVMGAEYLETLQPDEVLNTNSTQPEKRKALDGHLYTYKDFIDHYGERRGNTKWTQAVMIRTLDKMGAEYLETLQPDPGREALPEYGWEYMDLDNTIKGPFSRLEMRVRSIQGNFYPGTPLRFDSNDKFMPLSELFPEGTVPFVTAVSQRNKSTEPPEQMQLSAREFYGEIEIDPVDTMKRAGILDSTFSVPSLFSKDSYLSVFTKTSLCSEDLPGVERLVAWAELTDTLLFYYLWYEGFHAPDECIFFACNNWDYSSSTWIYAWLSDVVCLNYVQINRFLTVCSSTVWM